MNNNKLIENSILNDNDGLETPKTDYPTIFFMFDVNILICIHVYISYSYDT